MPLPITLSFPTLDLPPPLDVHEVHLDQTIHQGFVLTLHAVCRDGHLDRLGLAGRPVVVSLDEERFVRGIEGLVRRVALSNVEPTGVGTYEITVVPRLALADIVRNHRIFHAMSPDQVVAQVIEGYGGRIPAAIVETEALATREYTVQYGETDGDFMRRILAESGVVLFLDPSKGWAPRLVSDTTVFTPALEAPVPYVPPSSQVPQRPHIQHVSVRAELAASEARARDYDFKKPAMGFAGTGVPLETRAITTADELAENEGQLEIYAFEIGAFGEAKNGAARSQHLLEAERALVDVVTCRGNFLLVPGTRFTLLDAPRAEANGDLLVIGAKSRLAAGANGNTVWHQLVCIPAGTPYRPRTPNKPRIAGAQTAFVTGATPNGTVDIDELGRVLIELVWDRPEQRKNPVCRRTRVAQGWAGSGFGLVTWPRVGDEVVVTFLDGDPDEPLVVGCVHNGVSRAPLTLPAPGKTASIWQTRSFGPEGPGEGYNAIILDDEQGAELFVQRAERDFISLTNKNAKSTVGVNQSCSVGNLQDINIGGDQSISVKGTIQSTAGGVLTHGKDFYTVSSGGAVYLTGRSRIDESEMQHKITTGAFYVKAADVVQTVSNYTDVYAGSRIRLMCGGSSITLEPGGIKIESSGPVTVNGSVIKLNC